MRPDALVWYFVAYALVLLRLICSAEAGQWLQQRVQVLVKSLQVQHRQWGARRAASQSSQPSSSPEDEGEGVSVSATTAVPAADATVAEAEAEAATATPGGAGAGSDAGRGAGGAAGAAGGPRSSLAERLRVLRQYTGGADAPAPLRRLKQRFFSVVGAGDSTTADPEETMRVHRATPSAAEPAPATTVPPNAAASATTASSSSEDTSSDAATGDSSAAAALGHVPPSEDEGRASRVRQRMLSEDLVGARELAPIKEDGGEVAPATPGTACSEDMLLLQPYQQQLPPPPTIVLEQADGCTTTEVEDEDGEEAGEATGRALQPLKLRPSPTSEDAATAPARKSPVTVQEWVDSLPHVAHSRSEEETEEPVLEDGEEALDLGLGAEAGLLYNGAPVVTVIGPPQLHPVTSPESKLIRRDGLAREPSVQSDVTSHGSHGSSVESYLESRKPDPEEVLLSLGFGGPVSSLDSEVTRIPRRFLQPSKVKGVAIKDFLRHQQELIENFETGFCGYRGLTGSSSSMPSVIVAKIMEKLREHERESIHSAATSEYASFATTPPPEAGRRFSHHSSLHHHHHRHMLKRGSGASSSSPSPSSRQTATLSVLNADNRRFLESQGSKSPEVPRKRMIIGQRSFTFGRDGDLIELESPASSREDSSGGPPVPLPPLKPLVHKDSVLSSATDLSLTSVDSDSDTDERSGSYELHRRLRLPQSPVPIPESGQVHTSTPYSDNCSSPTDMSGHSEIESEKSANVKLPQKSIGFGKRLSSTSLSSWESDANHSSHALSSPIETSFGRARFSVGDQEVKEEYRHKSGHSLLSNLSLRYESIEEDVEMRTDSDAESNFPRASSSEDSKSHDGLVFSFSESPKEPGIQEEKLENDDCVFMSSLPSLPSKVPSTDDSVSATQARRGSLKRQQNVAEDDVPEILPCCRSEEKEKEKCLMTETCEQIASHQVLEQSTKNADDTLRCDETSYSGNPSDLLSIPLCDPSVSEDALSDFEGIVLPQLEIIEECLFKKNKSSPIDANEEVSNFSLPNTNINHSNFKLLLVDDMEMLNPPGHLQVAREIRGDSFEMEEIGNGEEDSKAMPLTRARSDSSGFLDCELERPLLDNSENKSWVKTESNKVTAMPMSRSMDTLEEQSSESKMKSNIGTSVPDLECKLESKRENPSLPVVCIVDESGGVLLSRSNSLHSINSNDTHSSRGSGNLSKIKQQRTKRIHSAPEALALASSCSSVSNMFSSCSDESVINVDLKDQHCSIQSTAEGIASMYRSNKDLQELLEELAVRGVSFSEEFDSSSFSSQHESQCTPLQADAVRAALSTYSSQLGDTMCSLQTNSELLESVADARHELEVVREIREQIAAELRRVASLLEEQPGPRAAAITRQMTVLLREQTRLCQQLEALSHGSHDNSISASGVPRTVPSSNPENNSVPCCNSEKLLGAVREENRRLERLVQSHTQELAEIRHLLRELVTKQNIPNKEL